MVASMMPGPRFAVNVLKNGGTWPGNPQGYEGYLAMWSLSRLPPRGQADAALDWWDGAALHVMGQSVRLILTGAPSWRHSPLSTMRVPTVFWTKASGRC